MFKEINTPENINVNTYAIRKVVRLNKQQNLINLKKRVDKLIKNYLKSCKYLIFQVNNIDELKALYNLKYQNLNIYINYTPFMIEEITKNRDIAKKFNITAYLTDNISINNIVSIITLLASLDIKVEITFDLFKNLNEENIESIIENIVKDKDILKNVNPIFQISNWIYNKNLNETNISLWRVFKDELDNYLYITEDANVTISNRFAKRNLYFFNLKDKEKSYKNSKLYKSIELFEEKIFTNDLECAFCKQYELCKGYFKFENNNFDCKVYKDLVGSIEKIFLNEVVHDIA